MTTSADEGTGGPRSVLNALFRTALAAVDPYDAVKRVLGSRGAGSVAEDVLSDLDAYRAVIVLGAGKATARMAAAAENILDGRISSGAIIVKYGHGVPLDRVQQFEAGHPVPDEPGVRGTGRVLELARSAGDRDLVLCLLSGGGSALLVAPAEGISIADKQQVTDLLLRSGADITEMNAVRKHLSAVKGGRLAREAAPAAVVSLLLSDVIGDRLDVIASGPTAPDRSTFAEAVQVVERYGLRDALPSAVAAFLERGRAGAVLETVKEDDPCLLKVRNVVVGSLRQALDAAEQRARDLGYLPTIMTDALQGDTHDAARMFAEQAIAVQKVLPRAERRCLLAGGETTLVVRGAGSGGRNQELALAFALAVDGVPGITLLSAGTDGTDGPTDAAGAVVDGFTAQTARSAGLDPASYLERNDSYGFFKELDRRTGIGYHLKTGPTGTNVMDLQLMIVEAP